MPPRLSLFATYIVLLAAAALVVIALVFDWGWPVPLVALSVSLALGLAALLVSARREADPGLRRFGLVAVGFVLAAALAVALVR